MKHFIDGNLIAFDCETTGIDVWHGDAPFGFSFCNEAGDTQYYEFEVDPFTRRVKPQPRLLERIGALLEDPRVTKVCHNGKFDVRMMDRNFGIKMAGPGGLVEQGGLMWDTLIMAHNCNTLENHYGLKQLADRYCDISTEDQDALQKITVKARNRAKKLGWKIAYTEQPVPNKPPKLKANVFADYWIPGMLHKLGFRKPDDQDWGLVCGKYAVLDATRTILLYLMYKDLIKELGVVEINALERNLWPVVYGMETRGVATDKAKLREQMLESLSVINQLLPKLQKVAKSIPNYNPDSSHHNRRLFTDILKLKITKMTKGGKYGTNPLPAVDKFTILEHIDHPVVHDLAVYRSTCKAYGSFFSKFDRLSIPDTAGGETALHCDYRQVGAATGRLSSANPNLQNVMTPENTMAVHPIHVRPAFIVRPGMWWLCTDYDGMEIRMFAGISGEPTMMRAIAEGRSIHNEMTNTVWGGKGNYEAIRQAVRVLSLDGTGIGTSPQLNLLWKEWGVTEANVYSLTQPRKEEIAERWLADHGYDQVAAQESIGRKNSKTTIKSLSFLKIYGGGAEKATLLLRIPVEEAREVLRIYDNKFPRIDEYSRELIREAKRNGFITSLYERRLTINSDLAYRAVNYMVQGSSADLMKSSMVRVNYWLKKEGYNAHIIMTIHDEIVIEIAKEELTKNFIRTVCKIMADTEGRLSIPMLAEPKIVTHNWSIKKKVRY